MTHESSHATARVIQRCATHQAEVLSCRHAVHWPDGSRLDLHPVQQFGAPALYLRALHHGGQWLLVDLRQLVRALGPDLAAAPSRDQPGTVLYSLRAAFHTAAHCLAALQPLAHWPGEPHAADPHPHHPHPTTGALA